MISKASRQSDARPPAIWRPESPPRRRNENAPEPGLEVERAGAAGPLFYRAVLTCSYRRQAKKDAS
jgi:hypothetical protein